MKKEILKHRYPDYRTVKVCPVCGKISVIRCLDQRDVIVILTPHKGCLSKIKW